MVLRLRSTVGNVLVLLGLGLFVLGAGGLFVGRLAQSEGVPIAVIGVVLVAVAANVKRKAGS